MLFHTACLLSEPLLRPASNTAGVLPVQNGAPLGLPEHLTLVIWRREPRPNLEDLMKKILESGIHGSTLKITGILCKTASQNLWLQLKNNTLCSFLVYNRKRLFNRMSRRGNFACFSFFVVPILGIPNRVVINHSGMKQMTALKLWNDFN